jgi:hypothetical protein
MNATPVSSPVNSRSRRRRGPLGGTGKTHSEQETNAILRSIRNPVTYILHFGPAGHSIPPAWGGYDFKASSDDFTLRIDGKLQVLSSSEFGNLGAGYAGTYHGGRIGLHLALKAGDYYARKDEDLPVDDYESKRYIMQGYHLAIEQKKIEEERFRPTLRRLRSNFRWMGP